MQKGFALPLILIGMLVIAALGGIVYFSKLFQKATSPSPVDISPSPQPTPDETADWKTYTTSRFTFKYPPNLTIEERVKDFYAISIPSSSNKEAEVTVDTRLQGNYRSYDQAVKETRKGLTNTKEESLNGGVKISGLVSSGFGEGLPVTLVLFRYQQGAIVWELSGDQKYQSIFDQLRSTFKFLE